MLRETVVDYPPLHARAVLLTASVLPTKHLFGHLDAAACHHAARRSTLPPATGRYLAGRDAELQAEWRAQHAS